MIIHSIEFTEKELLNILQRYIRAEYSMLLADGELWIDVRPDASYLITVDAIEE
jgi:hypothetical protein